MRHTCVAGVLAGLLMLPVVSHAQMDTEMSATPNADKALTQHKMRKNSYKSKGMMPPVNEETMKKSMQLIMEMAIAYKLMEKPALATGDGGIVVQWGNRLVKYDKDLNVVKEVTLDEDYAGIQKASAALAKQYLDRMMDLVKTEMSGSSKSGLNEAADPASPNMPITPGT